jgi:hypothetical protein
MVPPKAGRLRRDMVPQRSIIGPSFKLPFEIEFPPSAQRARRPPGQSGSRIMVAPAGRGPGASRGPIRQTVTVAAAATLSARLYTLISSDSESAAAAAADSEVSHWRPEADSAVSSAAQPGRVRLEQPEQQPTLSESTARPGAGRPGASSCYGRPRPAPSP